MCNPEPIPDGSIYLWMYRQGLKHVDVDKLVDALRLAGKDIRKKDMENYWNGYYNSSMYSGPGARSILDLTSYSSRENKVSCNLNDYPLNPFDGKPEPSNRFVPCCDGKPLIRWSQGCMTKTDALAMSNCNGLAENLKGCHRIIIDFDGDHDKDKLDYGCINLGNDLACSTSAWLKPVYTDYGHMSVSLHVEFWTDRVIPTMHFPQAKIDIIGNEKNSIRYFKNKIWNGIEPAILDESTWLRIIAWCEGKEYNGNSTRVP